MSEPRFTAQQKREAAEREVNMRRRVYPRWVEDGRMTQAKANLEITLMQEIAADYRAQEPNERLI